MQNWISDYLKAQQRATDSLSIPKIARCVELLQTAWREERQIFCIGNGGSASNASHFATDLGKGSSDKLGKRFRVLSLTDNISWITAIGNDYSYEDCFVRQLQNYGRAGDILISVSVSGNSPNIVKAVEWAKGASLQTIALVGAKVGRSGEIADETIVVDDTHYGRVEDAQMHVLHLLCYAFMEVPELGK